jgi:subtilisin family serine protease
MKIKKKILKIILLIIFFISSLNFSAEENITDVNEIFVGMSKDNVKYDLEILDNFNFTNKEKISFLNGDLNKISKKGNNLIHVTVDIRDTTNITIPNKNSPDYELKTQQKKEILIEQTNAVLSTLSDSEFKLKRNSEFGGFFSGNITKEGFDKLLKDKRVKHIYAEKDIQIHLDDSAPLINADDVWVDYNGTDQTICVIDTGVDYTDSDLGGCFGLGCRVKGGYDYVNGDADPFDDNGHGTNVAGIIISTGPTYKGIANDAKIVALKAGDEDGNFDEDDIKSSLQWCYNNHDTYNISIVTMSFGSLPSIFEECGEDFADQEIENLYEEGIIVVASSGNNENYNKISYPSCNEHVLSVGAVFDKNIGSLEDYCTQRLLGVCINTCTDEITYADRITCFTNRGSLLDLLAPGCYISTLGGSTLCGTSQAAPHVAGAAALMLEKNPTLKPDDIKFILQNTGVSVGNWKRINVEAALNLVEEEYDYGFDFSDSFFSIKNSFGNTIAWFEGNGNLNLKGNCSVSGNCIAPANSFIIQNSLFETVAYISSDGNLCLEGSSCSDLQLSCNPQSDAFVIQNIEINKSYLNFTGGLCLTGNLNENVFG